MSGEQVYESSCLSMFKPFFKICSIFKIFALYMTLILLIVMWAVLCLIILAMCVYSERISCLH